jgi:hypothetical protein
MGNWRWQSWALFAWAGIAVGVSVVIIAAASGSGREYEAGQTVGEMFWPWLIGFVILGVVWRRERPGKSCPRCGFNLPMSATSCRRCGYYPGLPMGPIAGPGPQYNPGYQAYPPQPPQQQPAAAAPSYWPPAPPVDPPVDPPASS